MEKNKYNYDKDEISELRKIVDKNPIYPRIISEGRKPVYTEPNILEYSFINEDQIEGTSNIIIGILILIVGIIFYWISLDIIILTLIIISTITFILLIPHVLFWIRESKIKVYFNFEKELFFYGETKINLNEIIAIQIVSELVTLRSRRHIYYNLNLVLNDLSRFLITSEDNLNDILEEADIINKRLQAPIWNDVSHSKHWTHYFF